jgi:hypothetical protein
MPDLIARYQIYVDLKYLQNALVEALSKTALECLASGLFVLDHRLRYVHGLPPEHSGESAARRALEIYDFC